MNLYISSYFWMGVLFEVSHSAYEEPREVHQYYRIGDGSTKVEGETIKGVDMSPIDNKNVIKMLYCEQGNTQVKNFLQINSNNLEGVGEIGVFKVEENIAVYHYVNGCECRATRSFIAQTDDLQAGPISVYILKTPELEV